MNGISVILKLNLASEPILSSIITNIFIVNILVITPSGNGVKYLNITVSIPRNSPYSICPIGVTGLVTGSVAMKTAPNINPPVVI